MPILCLKPIKSEAELEHSGKGHLEDLVCYGLEWERSVWFGMAKIWLCVVWFGIVDHLGHSKAPPPRHHLSSDLPEFGFDFFI